MFVLFLVDYNTVKMDIIKYYLLPNFTTLFWLCFFGLFTSSLLWEVKTHFDCCILQPSSIVLYLGIEMIEPGKSFLKFDFWSNKAFKNYNVLI